MKTLEVKQAIASLAEYARNVKTEPVILTIAGKPVALLVAIENADAETISLSTNPQFLALIERSPARHSAIGRITGPEMRRRLGLRQTATARSR